MQALVCQTSEAFSPEIAQAPQILQKSQEVESPRQSDFLSMLNENLQKEEAPKEAQSSAPEKAGEDRPQEISASQEKPKDGEIAEKSGALEEAQEKAESKKSGEVKKTAKKEPALKEGQKKVDAFIQGALASGEPKKAAENSSEKKAVKFPAKKVEGDSSSKKIDPKQLEFLRKISQEKNSEGGEKKESAVLEKVELAKGLENEAASLEASFIEGQNGVQEALDFSGAFESQKSGEPAEAKVFAAKKEGRKSPIQVTDLRTKAQGEPSQKEGGKDVKKTFVASVKESSKGNVEMTLDLNGQNAEKNILTLDGQSAASDGSTFQAMLKNQIAQNAGDFVRAGNIVLRDNNQGQINLILHPEELGNVKISMEMNGKTVVGHITVSSKEALEAFNQSADALKNAFVQSGFEDASFDVSFAGSQMQFAQGQEGGQGYDGNKSQGRKIYGEFAQESLTSVQESSDTVFEDDVSVNIVA